MATRHLAPTSSRRPMRPEGETEPEEVIGDFQRGKEIGKGSFATVYLARHRRKKSYAAVKCVHQSRLSDKLKVNLYLEIKLMKEIDHPHIVALFTCQETPSHFYLIMEYCQLSDLSQFLKKRQSLANLPETADIFRRYPNPTHGGFNEVLSRHFMKQITSALGYLRSKNMVHRDIKPQNLLLNPAPSYMYKQRPEDVPLAASEGSLVPRAGVQSLPMLKIADFGFARHLPSTALAETLCGSPLYMAPEILRYEKYDAKADLWSVGGVLYEMVVGRPPFRAPNHVDLLRRIEKTNDNITFDNKNMVISRGMKDLIRALLKKNPLERMTYEELFANQVITEDIPGLVEEDRALQFDNARATQPEAMELSRRMAKQAIDNPTQPGTPPEPALRPKGSQDEANGSSSRKTSDQDNKPRPEDVLRRKPSNPKQELTEPLAVEMKRRPSQREQPKQRRPSLNAHATAPGRQELLTGQAGAPSSAPRMERRPSRASPLAGPPMVREPTDLGLDRPIEGAKMAKETRERIAQDMAFEKEYVVVEKRAVEINAFADELDANRGSPQGALAKRVTTQGQVAPAAGVQPSSPSRAMVPSRPGTGHQRVGSFERRYAPSPQSATNMLTKALNAANVRLFGALGTSPPFGKGTSPPRGYSAYPAYPTPQGALLLCDGNDTKTPMDEDSKMVKTMEDAAHRSDVIFGFAEVKYKQLQPATPSTHDVLGIQQIGAQEKPMKGAEEDDQSEEDKDITNIALVGVAEEALVLYVKTLAILAKTIDLAGYWWSKQSRGEAITSEPASRPSNGNGEVGKRMNSVVQWARERFNVCLEKSEVVGRRLQVAQWQLPSEHPGHPNNQTSASSATTGTITTSAEHIQLTTGVTAEKLMFERAIEMSRASAVAELVGEDLQDSELGYVTAIMLLEAVLESDDEPLMKKSASKKEKSPEQAINGLETEDRQTVIKLIESARSRLNALRKRMQIAQGQSAKRSSQGGSGNATPKPVRVSPAPTPAVMGTPPN